MRNTIKSAVLAILRSKGSIDNYYCIDNHITTRLSDCIFRLVNEGKIEIDDEKSGYLPNSKNWNYVTKPRKTRDIFVNGSLVKTIFT